jgi:hypothetical protein
LKSVDDREAIHREMVMFDTTKLEDSEPFTDEDELQNELVLEDFYHYFFVSAIE